MFAIAISLFLTGMFLGLGPCLASCGPLLVSYIAARGKNYTGALWTWFVFSIARVFAYCLLGVLSGMLGQVFIKHIYGLHIGRYISIFGGLFVIALSIAIFFQNKSSLNVHSFIEKHFIKDDTKSIFIFGLIVGMVPCAPLIGIFLTMGLMSRNIIDGIFFGLSFGLGTLVSPLLILALAAGSIERFLLNRKTKLFFSRICAIIIFILGILIILRAVKINVGAIG